MAQNLSWVVILCETLFAVLVVASVGLRFLSRKLARTHYWWDDWVCLASSIFVLAYKIFDAELAAVGLGQHADTLPDHGAEYAKQSHFAIMIYTISIATYKYALLLLYVRIFPLRWLRRFSWVLTALITIWMIVVLFTIIFECNPVDKAWIPSKPGTCFNLRNLFVAQSVPTIVFDVILTAIPIFIVWRVQISRPAKIDLTLLFLCSGIVTALSSVRLYLIVNQQFTDLTWDFLPLALVSSAEPTVGLFSASIPTFGILWKAVRRRIRGERVPTSYQGRSGSGGPSGSFGPARGSKMRSATERSLGAKPEVQLDEEHIGLAYSASSEIATPRDDGEDFEMNTMDYSAPK